MQISFYTDNDAIIKKVDREAKNRGWSRSKMLEYIVDNWSIKDEKAAPGFSPKESTRPQPEARVKSIFDTSKD